MRNSPTWVITILDYAMVVGRNLDFPVDVEADEMDKYTKETLVWWLKYGSLALLSLTTLIISAITIYLMVRHGN